MGMEYIIPARLTYLSDVTVEADSYEEAKTKFEDGDWIDAGLNAARLIDYVSSKFKFLG